MKVAVVGAGKWGRNLVRTFYELGTLEAVADSSPEVRRQLLVEYPSVQIRGDLGSVLAGDVSAVVIATPAQTHYALAREALLAGKDVFVEKPLALSVREAEDLVALARHAGRVLMVGHLALYQPAVQWIKQYLSAGFLGRVYALHAERVKLGRVRRVEDVLWSFAVHDLAVFLYLMDSEPEACTAASQAILQKGIADDVYVHLTFPGDVRANLHVSWFWPEHRRNLILVGSQGMLVYDEASGVVTLHHKWVDSSLVEQDKGAEVVYRAEGEDPALLRECKDFLEAVARRVEPLASGSQGLAVVKVLASVEAALDSIALMNGPLPRPG